MNVDKLYVTKSVTDILPSMILTMAHKGLMISN